MNYGKLSLPLCALMREYTFSKAVMNADYPPRPQGFLTSPERLLITVFVHCRKNVNLSGLPGIRVISDGVAVKTAEVEFVMPVLNAELRGIYLLSSLEEVYYVSVSIKLKPYNDIAAEKIGLSTHFRFDRPGLTGKGVVVGIIDSGIDSSHPVFAGRVHSIWDQIVPGGDAATPYGLILKGDELTKSRDTNGHGTHIAGIAAGADDQFGGAAPEADIVVVKTDFQTAHIADAIRHIFNVADELGKPAVVNLSMGGQLDSHDGIDDLAKFIEQELKDKPGRIVVAAAGNDGANQNHARVELLPGQEVKIPISVEVKSIRQLILRGWYDSGGDCRIRISSPSGTEVTDSLGDFQGIEPDFIQPIRQGSYSPSDSVFMGKTLIPSPLNNCHEFWLDTRRVLLTANSSEFVESGDWKLSVKNRGIDPVTFDIWLWSPEASKEPKFFVEVNNPNMKIGAPGSAPGVITVASYTTRVDEQSAWIVDTISNFSSPGLLRNGDRKPDLAAPGAMIISADLQQTEPPLPETSLWRSDSGTSMAAAFVTGICSLLLQNNPRLTPAAVKIWLQNNSYIPDQPANTYDEKWGYGLLNLRDINELP